MRGRRECEGVVGGGVCLRGSWVRSLGSVLGVLVLVVVCRRGCGCGEDVRWPLWPLLWPLWP